MWKSVLAISAGASVGAVLRWGVGKVLNSLWSAIPLGTLAVNVVGGFCIGIALRIFTLYPGLAPEWRLLVITGFLGGLTTFSTFTAEIGLLLQEERTISAITSIILHVGGSLAAFFLGILLTRNLGS